LTSFDFGWYLPDMLRKPLAVVLIVSWIILSGFDLLEDLDFPIEGSVHGPLEGRLPNMGPGVDMVNNLLESGDCTRLAPSGLRKLPVVDSPVDAPAVREKASKIYKLHCAFLI
jgi:hypothetical protein